MRSALQFGALFLDAGNVWNLKNFFEYEDAEDGVFRLKDFWREMALGTGFGVRYDLDFFVLRLDLGIGLHQSLPHLLLGQGRLRDVAASVQRVGRGADCHGRGDRLGR